MGSFLSNLLGTNNQVSTNQPSANIQPWQQQEQQLANLLQGQAAGTSGPNPAQQQYLQNANAIAQQQAQVQAQNRAMNPGAAARQASTIGANAQQQAAGQAGIQQAQQQLASQGLLGTTLFQGVQGTNTATGVQAGIGAGNQQASESIVGGLLNGAASAAGLGASGGSAGGSAAMAKGGKVQHLDDGGPVLGVNTTLPAADPSFGPNLGATNYGVQPLAQPQLGESVYGNAPASQTGGSGSKKSGSNAFSGLQNADPGAQLQNFMSLARYAAGGQIKGFGNPMVSLHQQLFKENKKLAHVPEMERLAHGGKVPVMVSPGEGYADPADARAVADGRASPKEVLEKIPGKAQVSGDSYRNDTVKRNLDEGGVVVPRSVMESDNPEKEAAKFIAKHLRSTRKAKTPEKQQFLDAVNRSIKERKSA